MTRPKCVIQDNFLNLHDFQILEDVVMPYGHTHRSMAKEVDIHNVPWFFRKGRSAEETNDSKELNKNYTKYKTLEPIEDKVLQHTFMFKEFRSSFIEGILPLLYAIDPLAFCRIVANLTFPQKENKRSFFHVDRDKNEYPISKSMTTSIFYMNTTDGPTILEDGTEVECRANRLVSFPTDTQHSAVLCTDAEYRVVINLNYFK